MKAAALLPSYNSPRIGKNVRNANYLIRGLISLSTHHKLLKQHFILSPFPPHICNFTGFTLTLWLVHYTARKQE